MMMVRADSAANFDGEDDFADDDFQLEAADLALIDKYAGSTDQVARAGSASGSRGLHDSDSESSDSGDDSLDVSSNLVQL